MTDDIDKIIFEDPDEELDELMEGESPEEEATVELPQATRTRWNPSGPCFRAEMAEDSPRFCVDGVMMDQISAETVDPDSMNFLLEMQKEKLEPDEAGPIPVGGSYRALDYDELGQVLEDRLSCPFCRESFTEEDCDHRELGSLVYYGSTPEGKKTVWHWACLALQMLILAKGHPEVAAQRFNVDIRDLRAIKSSYRAIPWGRLGWRRG